MDAVLTALQMQSIEKAAMAAGEARALDLMERAGEAVFEEILKRCEGRDQVAHIYCGPGNNGGDGYVIARLLAEAFWQVHVFAFPMPASASPEARENQARYRKSGSIEAFEFEIIKRTKPPAVIVDALFGTGLTRPLDPKTFGEIFDWVETQDALKLAVDIASGLSSDSGHVLGTTIPADVTISFHRPKLGHLLAEGAALSGELRIVPIGLETSNTAKATEADLKPAQCLSDSQDDQRLLAKLQKQSGHKFEHGHALVLSGGFGKTGAARLAARGALRIGAGLVTIGAPQEAQREIAAHITSLMLREINTDDDLLETLKDDRINALCLGPGLGIKRAGAFLQTALQSKRPIVLDADALTALAQTPERMDALHENCILTPHGGEFQRVFPDLFEAFSKGVSKVEIVKSAAARSGAVVLFKGEDSVIADPKGAVFIHSAHRDRAAPWLATAGSGDVLAGFITGLLARGFSACEAACLAVGVHVDCARAFGAGLIAEDLPDMLPKVFRAQEKARDAN